MFRHHHRVSVGTASASKPMDRSISAQNSVRVGGLLVVPVVLTLSIRRRSDRRSTLWSN